DDDIVLVHLLLIMVTEYDSYLARQHHEHGVCSHGMSNPLLSYDDDIVLVCLLLIMVTEYDTCLGGVAPRAWCL
ncbi:hypothetical protein Tco_1342533, partial [Tanacetum coccineum]